nr:efflux RND transporter periplasmic adaptor subunit [uncultured Rhodopila sp.]
MKRAVIVVVLLAAAAGGAAFYHYRGTGVPPVAPVVAVQSVSTTPVQIAPMVERVASYGNLVSARTVDIVPETPGIISQLLFTDGQKVRAGAPLVQMDSSISLAQLQSARAQAETDMQNLRRTQSLAKQGLDSSYSVEQALSRAAASEAEVKINESKLSHLMLRAPFAGTLNAARFDAGGYVNAGDRIVRLEDTDNLQVEFRMPSAAAMQITSGMPIQIQVPGTGEDRVVDGKLTFVDPVISTDTRSILLRAETHGTGDILRPGLYVRVSVDLQIHPWALVVPTGAVASDLNSSYVFVVESNTIARKRDVTVGLVDGERTELLDGVKAGDLVVSIGQFRLRDGDAVKVVPAPAEAKSAS